MMTGSEWDASGWNVLVEIPETGTVSVGPRGNLPKDDMLRLDPTTLPPFLKLLTAFPGSRAVGVAFNKVKPEEQFPTEAPTEGPEDGKTEAVTR